MILGAPWGRLGPSRRNPTHQLGGDVLGEAHRCNAIGADHQQGDDDVNTRQPVGEVGPGAGGLQSAWRRSHPPFTPFTWADTPRLLDHLSSAFPIETWKMHMHSRAPLSVQTHDGFPLPTAPLLLTGKSCCAHLKFLSPPLVLPGTHQGPRSPGPLYTLLNTWGAPHASARCISTPVAHPPHLPFLTSYNLELNAYQVTLSITVTIIL